MPRSMPQEILAAAQAWKSKMLEGSGSLLGPGSCWDPSTISDLRNRYEGNLIEGGEAGFLGKLKIQLSGAPETTVQLASEIVWLLYLFPSNIGREKKLENIGVIRSWAGLDVPSSSPALSDDVLAGVGSGGPGYLINFWKEFLFALILCDELSRLDRTRKEDLLRNGDRFALWLDALPASENRQFRHVLLFLLFPELFERISSKADKPAILSAFKEKIVPSQDKRLAIDLALRSLRIRIAKDRGTEDFDFYDPDLLAVWNVSSSGTVKSTGSNADPVPPELSADLAAGVRYWLVGANWNGTDKTGEFVDTGLWMNGYEDKYLDTVKTARPGDRIAVKAAFRQKKNLPFDNKGHDVGIMRMKARGTVKENPGDGRRLVIEWEEDFEPFDLFGYVWWPTISELSAKKWPEVVGWVFYDVRQPIVELAREWWPEKGPLVPDTGSPNVSSGSAYEHKPINRIYYGPPGTGKTYKIFMESSDGGMERRTEYLRTDRSDGEGGLEMVAFHQSFSYEDFVQGLRPVIHGNSIVYEIREGLFKQLCKRAEANPEHKFALFIDEINRGNVSSIFGELITLIESDKRLRFTDTGEPDYTRPGTFVRLPLNDEPFGIPCNLDIYGTMNTADRSLVRVDTALRRRFEFVECMPDPGILAGRGIEGVSFGPLLARMNERIEALLDRDHTIGHAYFLELKLEEGIEGLARLFERKILPLLEEYFFDDWGKAATVLGGPGKEGDNRCFYIAMAPSDEDFTPGRFKRNPEALRNLEAYKSVYA